MNGTELSLLQHYKLHRLLWPCQGWKLQVTSIRDRDSETQRREVTFPEPHSRVILDLPWSFSLTPPSYGH